MNAEIQTVHANEYRKIFGKRAFVALPQEEIDRLYASLEVLPANQYEVEDKYERIQLSLFVVAHHNYSWLINRKLESNIVSLGFFSPLLARPNGNMFLDESIKTEAKRIFNQNIRSKTMYDVRLAGLIYDESGTFGKTHVGIACVCRLRQKNQVEPTKEELEIGIMGNGEIMQKQDQFDTWSKILIENINAM